MVGCGGVFCGDGTERNAQCGYGVVAGFLRGELVGRFRALRWWGLKM